MGKILFKRLFLFSFLAVLVGSSLAGILYWLDGQSLFNLKEIFIHQANRSQVDVLVQKKMSQLQLKLEKLEGQSLLKLKLKTIRDEVLAEHWVNSVVLSRHWPDTLEISITAKGVATVLFNKNGSLNPVMEGGGLLETTKEAGSLDLVVLRGESLEKQQALRQKAIEFLKALPKEGLLTKEKVSDIEYNDKEGFWLSLIGSGTKVIMGQGPVAGKIKRVNRVLEYMESHQVRGRVIDARFSKKVLVKLRKKP